MSSRWIEVDEEVLALLQEGAEPLIDSPNRVLRRLLGIAPGACQEEARMALAVAPGRRARAPLGSLLHLREYELPLLRALFQRGGRAPAREVMAAVGEALADRLTALDRQNLASGPSRFESRISQVRLRLVQRGLLESGSPRAWWELTEAGIEELGRLEAEAQKREREAPR
jgi:Mrr N-terminal domain